MTNIAVIVDLETTGLDGSLDQIIEIGAIKVDLNTGGILDQFQTFSLPECDYDEDDGRDDENDNDYSVIEDVNIGSYKLDPFIVKLTGITDEMLIDAPSNQDAVDAFFEFAEDLTIWAYNAGFDSKFLNKHTSEQKSLRDILAIAKRAFPNLNNYKLATVAKHLDISIDGAHRAIADCLMSKEVLTQGLKLQAYNHIHIHGFKASDYTPSQNGYFYGKTIVFTGIDKDKAAEHASKLGFEVKTGVSKKTNYLVVGVQNFNLLASHDKSLKHRKAEELISKGLDIEIITENDFYNFIN